MSLPKIKLKLTDSEASALRDYLDYCIEIAENNLEVKNEVLVLADFDFRAKRSQIPVSIARILWARLRLSKFLNNHLRVILDLLTEELRSAGRLPDWPDGLELK